MRELSSYNVGVYCRLSKQDKKDKQSNNGRREESVSIQTQRDILSKYVNDRKEKGWLLHGIEPKPARWNAETVIFILRNRTYLGDTVQGIYDVARFHRTPTKRHPKEE